MDFWEHLSELRTRLIRCIIWVSMGAVAVWYFYPSIFNLLSHPIEPFLKEMKGNFIVVGVTEPFMIKLELSLIVGAVLASPLVLAEIWGFLAPALRPEEKKWAKLAIFPSALLFLAGVVCAYLVIPPGFRFLLEQSPPGVTPFLSINNYLMLLAKMFIAFGLFFQLPLLLMFLGILGIVNSSMLWKRWREAIVAIFVIGAIITPTVDIATLCIVSLPIVLLYGLSILLVLIVEKRKDDSARD